MIIGELKKLSTLTWSFSVGFKDEESGETVSLDVEVTSMAGGEGDWALQLAGALRESLRSAEHLAEQNARLIAGDFRGH